MDINPTRLTSLLKEALTPQPAPSARPDPVTAALVKALVQPPAPSTVQSAQFAAQTLNGSLAKPPAQSPQRLSSVEIENAYRAVIEPDASTDSAAPRTPSGRQPADADQPPRAVAQAQPAAADNAVPSRAATPVFVLAGPCFRSAVCGQHQRAAARRRSPRPRSAIRTRPDAAVDDIDRDGHRLGRDHHNRAVAASLIEADRPRYRLAGRLRAFPVPAPPVRRSAARDRRRQRGGARPGDRASRTPD